MISVIVPFQKGVHYLKDCLESLAEQTLKDFEVILVYNHTSEGDAIEAVVTPFQSLLNLKTFTCEKEGVAAVRNFAMTKASGDYIYFLDSDDYINENTLELLMQEAKTCDADFAYGSLIQTWLQKKSYRGLEKEEKEDVACSAAETMDVEDLVGTREVSDEERPILYHFFTPELCLDSISTLNILIKKSVATKYAFDEESTLFADLSFVMHLLTGDAKSAFVPAACYMKRSHNDPVNYRAICQYEGKEKMTELFAAYNRMIGDLPVDHIATIGMHYQLLSYITLDMMLRYDEKVDKRFRTTYYDEMCKAIAAMDPSVLKSMNGYVKRMGKALGKKNRFAVNWNIFWHQVVRKTDMMFHKKNYFKTFFYKNFTKLSMKENWVLLETFRGKSYSDSPKYIYEYLAKTYPGKYKFIWAINHKMKLPYGGVVVKRFGLRYMYYLARAKYVVFNVRQPVWYKKRKGGVFLDTWHGTPLKRLVFHQEEVAAASPLYKYQFYKQSRMWDYLISPNDFCTDIFETAFMFDRDKIIPCGYPRNDVLYTHNNEEGIKAFKKKVGVPEEKKVILYAPTWRDDQYQGIGEYLFTLELDLKLLRERLKDDYVLVLRTHYFIANNLDVSGVEDFVYNASDYDDISELYLIADILITDYSSVFFDYANLKRPMLFFTYDLDKYRDMLRGFYLDMEKELPGPLLFTSEEVVDAIEHIDDITEKYKDTYETFYNRFCHIDDGRASERIAELVFEGNDWRKN